MNTFQKSFAGSWSFIQMEKLNVTSFGLRRKSIYYLKLKITLNILFVLYTKEIVVEEINHVRETMTNAITRIDEREQPIGKSESSKHLRNNPGHELEWIILSRAPSHHLKRKILEAYFTYFIDLNQFLNDQLESKILILFRHGVT